jgi:hypothetical protein
VRERRSYKIELSNMRHALSLSPQWAYPASSFPRAMGIVFVALAIGATAGGAVVFSFVYPPPDQTSLAARSLPVPIEAASTPSGETPNAQPRLRGAIQKESAKDSGTDDHVESGSAEPPRFRSATLTPGVAATAALAEARSASNDLAPKAEPTSSPVTEKSGADKKMMKKHHAATRFAWRVGGPFGALPGVWGRY